VALKTGAPGSFGAQLKALREAAGFTQEELATIAGLSVQAVSALERGQRRRPHPETVRALSAALDLNGAARDTLMESARTPLIAAAVDELSSAPLPIAPTSLIGRDEDLKTLRGWLMEPATRLVTLTGPGGAGKTRLALELARWIAGEGVTRVVLVPLAAVRDPAFVALRIAEAIGLSDVRALELPSRARIACGDRATVLVIDNFEHVLEAASLTADLLASNPSLKLLVTSRAPLRVRGEREYAVGPLPLTVNSNTSPQPPADLARVPAVRLFLERVRDVQSDFRLTPENGPIVTAICRRLDALPLALELAAPWIKILTVEDLLNRLERDVLLSPVGARDLPERQQTMSTTIAWSYQLLDSDERRAFRRLGALPGRFSIEAAAAVLAGRERSPELNADVLGTVASLIDKSLLHRADTPVVTRPLYYMLETVRAYATIELNAAGERDDVVEGLVRYCISEASRAGAELVGPAQAEWLDRVRDDLENYRAVLGWLIESNRADEAANIAWDLLFFWLIQGRGTEGLQWYHQTLNVPGITAAAESKALVGASVMGFTHGQLADARDWLTRALTLSSDDADRNVVSMAESLFGHLERASGNLDAARERFTRSIQMFQEMSCAWGTGHALLGIAGIALLKGDIETAERVLDEATSVLRPVGPWFLNLPLYLRANLAVRRGNADAAIALIRESLCCSREVHDKFAFVFALTPLAAAAVLKGDDAWAARVMGTWDAVTERSGGTTGDKSVLELRQRTEQGVRERLGPTRWARAYAAGRTASIDSLLKDIDSARAPEVMGT
jgi:predicted ATPase/DNA-binding XRE family transcriptional regulator